MRISINTHGDLIRFETLRMLWIFHFASTSQLARLVWGANTPWNKERHRPTLEELLENDLIWREPLRSLTAFRGHTHGKIAGGWFYGLTERGREYIVQHIPQLENIHCMTRERYFSENERRIMHHSFNYTEFCTFLIEGLRSHPLTVGMFFDTECTRLGSHLRMDGLFRLRLRRRPLTTHIDDARFPWDVPWLFTLRSPLTPDVVDVTFAIEIDQGSEELQVIQRKALNYMRTFAGGLQPAGAHDTAHDLNVAWSSILCPIDLPEDHAHRAPYFPVPVFIVPGIQRGVNVHAAWQRGWPTSELRVTSWMHIHEAGSVLRVAYLELPPVPDPTIMGH